MSYKIVVDSCCELPEEFKNDDRFEIVPLELYIGDYQVWDDENFNQEDFLKRIAESSQCAKTACPSPEKYMEAYNVPADDVFVVTLSSKLSGSYNSAVLGKNLYYETYGENKNIHICDSESACCGETQLALKAMELEEAGLAFEQIVKQLEAFRDAQNTYFVLDNLETLRKNGRLTGVKAVVASTLSIKPVMGAEKGMIVQRGQAVGIKKALVKMVDMAVKESVDTENKNLVITHVNCPERAEKVKQMFLEKLNFKGVYIFNAAGVGTVYANDGGIIVTV
ncbi:MAG: DegV family protein [Lachnospiraceae bacterium]|nr:DegV family protein [Lachnospiraceae bacterium]